MAFCKTSFFAFSAGSKAKIHDDSSDFADGSVGFVELESFSAVLKLSNGAGVYGYGLSRLAPIDDHSVIGPRVSIVILDKLAAVDGLAVCEGFRGGNKGYFVFSVHR